MDFATISKPRYDGGSQGCSTPEKTPHVAKLRQPSWGCGSWMCTSSFSHSQEKLPISLCFFSQINSSFPFTNKVSTSLPWNSSHPLFSHSRQGFVFFFFLNSGVIRENWETLPKGESEIWKPAVELWWVGFGVLLFFMSQIAYFQLFKSCPKASLMEKYHFPMLKK